MDKKTIKKCWLKHAHCYSSTTSLCKDGRHLFLEVVLRNPRGSIISIKRWAINNIGSYDNKTFLYFYARLLNMIKE